MDAIQSPAELLPLAALSEAKAEEVGTKAAVLARLLAAGFPVPSGLCLTVGAFRAALAPFAPALADALQNGNLLDPAEAQSAALQIHTILASLTFPLDLHQALARELPSLGAGPLAVRSSATYEDLPRASFAGQYQTLLGLAGLAGVEDAVLACWRSFFGLNALAARARFAGAGQPAMAVLIQPLLDAECAGVCFSVDPVRQSPETIAVIATWGLGAGVVDGTVPADTARLRRHDLTVEAVVLGTKNECLRRDPSGGVRRAAVPAHLQQSACLPEPWLQTVAQFGLALEQFLGYPQDVEWAIANDQLWILQSRPITTLPPELVEAVRFPIEWADERERRAFWYAPGLPTHPPGALLLPAEIDYAKADFEGGDAAVAYGGGSRTFWRKYVNGRFYWAAAESPLSSGDRRIRSAALEDLYDRLEEQDVTVWEHSGPEIIRATQRLSAFDAHVADGPAVANHLDDALAAARRHWMIHTLVPRKRNGRLLDAYQAMTGVSRDEADQFLSQLLEGEETVQTRLIDDLYALACLAQEAPPVAVLLAERPAGLYARLKALPTAQAFVQHFEQFLAVYGDRPGPGLGSTALLQTLPWRENAGWVLGMIAKYLAPPSEAACEAPRLARQRARQNRNAIVDELCASAAHPHLAGEFRLRLAYARRAATGLDDHNHYIDQLAGGQFYQALLYAGRSLVARGQLAQPEEAAWLKITETLGALCETKPQPLHATIAARQQQYARWRKQYAPAILGLPSAALPTRPPVVGAGPEEPLERATSRGNLLQGQGVSSGRRSGRARLISPSAVLPGVNPGDVWVAADAGTLWTPIFPILAGVILDSGHVGMHAAITVREFGVPAVFGTMEATRRIPDGAWVTLDGARGTVEWEQ